MGSLFSFFLLLLSLPFPPLSATSKPQPFRSPRLLDLIIRDYTFKFYSSHFQRTGVLHAVRLPANLSGIGVNTVRFRCGSLRRYGANIDEFHLGIGVTIHPCVERFVLIRQNLGHNWSALYYDHSDLSGYELITPILGLLAYNAGDDLNQSNPFELGIIAGDDPIKIDFRTVTRKVNSTKQPYCASFESGGLVGGTGGGRWGKATLANMVAPYVCLARKQGHFGLVVETAAQAGAVLRRRQRGWNVPVGRAIGVALGPFLLGLLLIAICVRVKKRTKMEEMARRAYEEEALQVSMVGHVRAPTAPVTRTLPCIEHHYYLTPPF
ncbi:hypothetical protein Nepgr_028456 [Nepenthes gracilis]|uniref:Uncharacterized protein n=1 Tax=Nepenthes gracilis TaxID=150966 RepID=A0AAD3TAR3_NEPGR|nr:hypothetical protein Nepgr_028456 [Nepenthes gracilis]